MYMFVHLCVLNLCSLHLLSNLLANLPTRPKTKQALKTVLVGAGALKRSSTTRPSQTPSIADAERALLLQSTCATVVPKLVPQDLPVFRSLLQGVFPGADAATVEAAELRTAVATACERRQLVVGDKCVVDRWFVVG